MKRRDGRCRTTTMGSAWGAEGPSCTMTMTTAASRDGRHRVHYDAELAVIGVGLVRVVVRYLGYGQQAKRTRHRTATAGKKPCQKLRFRGNMP